MPLAKIQCTKEITTETLQLISDIIKDITGKQESHIMVTADLTTSFCMNREEGDGAFIDIRGVGGFSKPINTDISKQVSELLVDTLNINPQRIFFNFTNLEGSFWGHSEGTY